MPKYSYRRLSIVLTLTVVLFGCKKKEYSDGSDGTYEMYETMYPEPCYKNIYLNGIIKDTITGFPITGLRIHVSGMGDYIRYTDSLGIIHSVYMWSPCGKFPNEKSDSATLYVDYEQPYYGRWKIDMKNNVENDAIIYNKKLERTGIIKVHFTDNSPNGTNLKINDFGMEGTGNINLREHIDTTIYRYAIPYQSKYISVGASSIVKDTTVIPLPGDTTTVTMVYYG